MGKGPMMRHVAMGIAAVAASLGLAVMAHAQSGDWRDEVKADDWTQMMAADTVIFFERMGPVDGAVHDVWIRIERAKPREGDGGAYLSTNSVYQANCETRQARLTASTNYTGHNLTGEAEVASGEATAWETPEKGRLMDRIVNDACGAAS